MRKIILIAYDLNPRWGSEAGFASAWLDVVCRHYQVEVFTQASNSADIATNVYPNTTFHFIGQNRILERTGRRIGLPLLSLIRATAFFWAVKRRLAEWMAPRAVFIHCLTPAGIHSFNSLYKLGIPVVVGPVGGALRTPRGFMRAFRKQWVEVALRSVAYSIIRATNGWKSYFENAALVILGSSLRRDQLPRGAWAKCIRIPDALVDTEYFTPDDARDHNAPVKVLFVGRLVSNKGPLLLIDAARACRSHGNNDFVVELAGWGALSGEIERMIRCYGLEDHVRLLGGLSKDEIRQKYRTSDIFCLPTLREPGGMAILEAMSCGLPIITSDYGGPAYLVTQECGIKISMRGYKMYVEELAEALSYLTSNPSIRKQMGEMARKRAQQEFSLQALENKILDAYGTVMLKRPMQAP